MNWVAHVLFTWVADRLRALLADAPQFFQFFSCVTVGLRSRLSRAL